MICRPTQSHYADQLARSGCRGGWKGGGEAPFRAQGRSPQIKITLRSPPCRSLSEDEALMVKMLDEFGVSC